MKTPDEFAEAMKERGATPPKGPEGEFVVSAPKKAKPANFWWPEISNLGQAIEASNAGFWTAMLVAALNAIVATISLIQHTSIGGVSPSGYIDAGLFALAGWSTRQRSRVGAVAGLLFFLMEKVHQFITQPGSAVGIGLALAILVGLISGVRGTFAYHRFAPEGFLEDSKPVMFLGVDLRRPIPIWVTAFLCVVILYILIMGWVGANLYFFALRAAVMVLAAMTLHAIFLRPAWGHVVAMIFSLLVAVLLVLIAAMSPAPSIVGKVTTWLMFGGMAALYAYAMCFGKPVRNYFAKPVGNAEDA